MTPISPVVPGQTEVIYAKDQPQYNPLPAIKTADGKVTSRWELSFDERMAIARGADVYLTQHTHNHPLQPVLLQVLSPEDSRDTLSVQGLLE